MDPRQEDQARLEGRSELTNDAGAMPFGSQGVCTRSRNTPPATRLPEIVGH